MRRSRVCLSLDRRREGIADILGRHRHGEEEGGVVNLDPFLPGLSPSLRDIPPPARHDCPTSIASAKSIATKAPSQAQRILDYLRSTAARGATHLEISEALGLPINVICGRFNALRTAGLVYATGDVRINARTRKSAIVWRAA